MAQLCFSSHTVLVVNYSERSTRHCGVSTACGASVAWSVRARTDRLDTGSKSKSGSIPCTGLSVITEAVLEFCRITFDLFPDEAPHPRSARSVNLILCNVLLYCRHLFVCC